MLLTGLSDLHRAEEPQATCQSAADCEGGRRASPLQLLTSDGQLEPAAGLPQLGQTLSGVWQGTQSS